MDKTNKVCTTCLTTFINFYKFQEKCIKADRKFRRTNDSKITLDVDTDSIENEDLKMTENSFSILHSVLCDEESSPIPQALDSPGDMDDNTEFYPVSMETEVNDTSLDKQDETKCTRESVVTPNLELSINFNGIGVNAKKSNYLVKIPQLKDTTEKQIKKYYKLKLQDGTITEIGDNFDASSTKKRIIRVHVDEEGAASCTEPVAINHLTSDKWQDVATIPKNVPIPNNLRFPIFNGVPCPCSNRTKMKQKKEIKHVAQQPFEPVVEPTPIKCTAIKVEPLPLEIYKSTMTIPTWVTDHNYRAITRQERQQFKSDLRKQRRVAIQISKSKSLPYQCILCLQHFRTILMLNTHRKDEHKVPPFLCLICNMEFTHVRFVERHQRHHLQRPLIDKCKVCEAE